MTGAVGAKAAVGKVAVGKVAVGLIGGEQGRAEALPKPAVVELLAWELLAAP